MKQQVVVIGAGGHAKVIIDILHSHPNIELIGCTDPGGVQQVLGVPVVGDDRMLPELFKQGVRHAFVAIGSNKARANIARNVEQLGFTFIQAISPLAYVAPSAVVGKGVAIMPGAIIQPEVHIGQGSIINTNASVDHECQLGDYCHIAPGVILSGNVRVGTGTFLGTGAKVIDGIQIGEGTMVGAGAAVVSDIPDRCLAVGVPARVVKTYE